jgi:hypothetical protein
MGFHSVTDIFEADLIASSTDSSAIGIHHSPDVVAQFQITNSTPGSGATGATGKVEVQTLTFPAGSTAVSGDYFAITDTAGLQWAVALQKKNIETLTFPAKAAVTAGDHIVVYDTNDVAWGISLNKSGTDPEPTGAIWAAIPAAKKVHVDISGATTGANVATLVEAAVDALTGFSAVITTTVSTADIAFAQASIGYVTPAIPLSADGTGAGSITAATTVLGADEPTGAIWASIAAARKAQATITAGSTAAQVAALVETAFDALTSVPIATDDTANNGTMIFTQNLRGNVANVAVKNKSDGTAGTITAANTTQGVDSVVNATANTLTLAAHGYVTGLKGQIAIDSGSLPTGLSALTDYFVIVVDANTIKLAASLANALAGTAIDIEDQGTADKTLTFTPTALAGGVCHLEGSVDKQNWIDITSATFNVTTTQNNYLALTSCAFPYIRANVTVTAGQLTVTGKLAQKGP